MAAPSNAIQLPRFIVEHLSRVDPQWQAIIDRASRGGPGSSAQKPLYIAFSGAQPKDRIGLFAAVAGGAATVVGIEALTTQER